MIIPIFGILSSRTKRHKLAIIGRTYDRRPPKLISEGVSARADAPARANATGSARGAPFPQTATRRAGAGVRRPGPCAGRVHLGGPRDVPQSDARRATGLR